MIRTLRRFLDSCRLDRGEPGGEFDAVHRALAGGSPRAMPSPQLRSRTMDSLRSAEIDAAPHLGWRWAAAGVASLLVAGAAVKLALPNPAPRGQFSGLPIPVDAGPVMRLVSGSVDKPLLDQAQKMYDDTRRATRLVASCVPFARHGG
jgi:hypothetical protein